ncbi:ankyrin repeat-containing domain protein [Radiomyces spectabilis]|uniref:ankyrin repeat-containing domain protein n=1 Tax=Radiomyces spectabilis TaxID=64574 RepID=UPI00221F98B6|nr:ankyrin repeat-containing domain protein [Radiomyces spectabilis]KAI8381431.1 ankyrin repeat-containing domain protein [Radiomyces spectabilis]
MPTLLARTFTLLNTHTKPPLIHNDTADPDSTPNTRQEQLSVPVNSHIKQQTHSVAQPRANDLTTDKPPKQQHRLPKKLLEVIVAHDPPTQPKNSHPPYHQPLSPPSLLPSHPKENEPASNNQTSMIPLRPLQQRPEISIWQAAENGDLEALTYFIQHPTTVDPCIMLNSRDPYSDCTLLHLIVSNVNENKYDLVPLLKLLLDHGADATARNIYNVQAIHMVSLHCKNPLPAIQLLLQYDASPNACDGDGWTPAHYAARFCTPPDRVLQLLVSHGADINLVDASRKSPMFGLLANGDYATTLDWLIHHAKANLTIQGDFLDQQTRRTRPGTLLLQAAKYARLECLQLLVRSAVAMNALRTVLTREELDYAITLVKDQRQQIETSATRHPTLLGNLERMTHIFQDLTHALEQDPQSLLSLHKKKGTLSSTPTSNGDVQGNESMSGRKVNLFKRMSTIIFRKRSTRAGTKKTRNA